MRYRPTFRTGIALLATVLVVGGIVAAGTIAGAPAAPDSQVESTTVEDGVQELSVEIDCAEREARVLAPDRYEYSITVATVEVSKSGTSTQSSTSGTYEGNETVSLEDDRFTFVFVTNASTDETVAASYENCALEEAETTAERTTRVEDGTPSIGIDCNESTVQITAPEDYEYGLKVGDVAITPGDVDSSSLATSEEGNATVTFEGDLVYVFVDDGSSADPVASTVEYCGPVPADEPDANRTTR